MALIIGLGVVAAYVVYWACKDVSKIFIICMILFVTWFLGNAQNIALYLHNHGIDFKTDDVKDSDDSDSDDSE